MASGGEVRVLFIIVNYRHAELCADLARRFLDLPGADKAHAHALIVDNSATEEDRAYLAQLPPREGFSVVTAPGNLGFYGGAHHALQTWLKSAPLPDWVIVSNPDIAFPDPGFLTKLLATELPSDCVVIAPDTRLAPSVAEWGRGAPQNPMKERRPSKGYMRLLEFCLDWPLLYWAMELRYGLRVGRATAPVAPESRRIYAPHGSFVIFSRRYFEAGADLKHIVFLYGEEMYVAEELHRRKLACWFEPQLKICHVGGASTSVLGIEGRRKHIGTATRALRRRYFVES